MKQRIVCLILICFYSNGLFAQNEAGQNKIPEFVEITLAPRTLTLNTGNQVQVVTEVLAGISKSAGETPQIIRTIRTKLGISPDSQQNFPIKKLVVAPQHADENAISDLINRSNNIWPAPDKEVVKVRLPEKTFHDWFLENNKIIYTVLRFIVNGTIVGASLIYSMNVPVNSALLIGMLAGTKSGVIQYNISTYQQWLLSEKVARKFNLKINDTDNLAVLGFKRTYNTILNTGEDYGKFALTETAYIALARVAMWLLDIPNLPTGFTNNLKNVLKTGYHATMSQGMADLGLFRDSQIQGKYEGWTNEFQEVFRNSFAFFISVASNSVSALELVNPGASGLIDFGFIEIPLGFVAISLLGIGFYLHALVTYLLDA